MTETPRLGYMIRTPNSSQYSSLISVCELQFSIDVGGKSLVEAEAWTAEWRLLQDRVAPLFRRADLRRQARDYVRGLLGPVGRKNCWQLAEFAGQRSPGCMQSMLARGSWDAAGIPPIPDFDIDPPTHRRWVLARRSISEPTEIAYYLAYAPLGTTVAELVRMAGMRWSIEDRFGAAKNECGLDECEVRRYTAWHRHITLSMLAFAFLAALAADAGEKAEAAVQPMSSTT